MSKFDASMIILHRTDRHFSKESGSLESQYEERLKSALRLWRSNAHSARTALCGAVLALSGTGTVVSVIPRPVPAVGHPSKSAGCLPAKKKKNEKKKLHRRRRSAFRSVCRPASDPNDQRTDMTHNAIYKSVSEIYS